MQRFRKILVIVTRRIGDVLLTTPLVRSLKQAWPEAEIDILVFAGTEAVLAGNPDINKVLTVPQKLPFKKHLLFVASLWRKYDLAIPTMTSDRPLIYAKFASAFTVGMIPDRKSQQWKGRLLTRSVPFDNWHTHTVLMNLKLAQLLNIDPCYQVVSGWREQDRLAVEQFIDPDNEPYAVLHSYPMYPYKAWPLKSWVELGAWIQKQGMRLVLTGSNGREELDAISQLASSLEGVINVAGKLNLPAVSYLLHKAKIYVGPDTVVTHMAAASGTQTIALFGPSNPVKWGPWPFGYCNSSNPWAVKGSQSQGNVTLLQGEGDCVPCFEEGCDRHTQSLSRCLQELTVERVKQAIYFVASQ